MSRATIILALVVACLRGQSLQLDRSFAPRITRPTWADTVLSQPDGKVIVYGANVVETLGQAIPRVVRFNTDGSLDPTFHFQETTTDYNSSLALKLLPDGKLLVLRFPGDGRSSLVRHHANGSTDDSFHAPSNSPFSEPWITDAQGRLYVRGNYPNASGGLPRFGFYRLQSDGRIDPSFRTVLDQTGPSGTLISLPGGKLLLTGKFSSVNDMALVANPGFVRLDDAGNLDPTFVYRGSESLVITALAPLPDGRLLAGATINNRNTIVRLEADGTLDPSYALAGANQFQLGPAAALRDGRIVAHIRRSRDAIALFRADGSLQVEYQRSAPFRFLSATPDTSVFVRDGAGATLRLTQDGQLAVDPFPQLRAITETGVLALRDGGVLITPVLSQPPPGTIDPPGRNGHNIRRGIARLKPDGSVDPTFRAHTFDLGTSDVVALAEEMDGSVLIGITFDLGPYSPLLRFRRDGGLDTSFSRNVVNLFAQAPAAAHVLPTGEILCASPGRYLTLDREGRLLAELSLPVGWFWPSALRSTAGGRIAVSGSFLGLDTNLRAPYFRIERDGTFDNSFAISSADVPRPEDLRLATIAPHPDGGFVAHRENNGGNRLVQRHASDGTLVRGFPTAPTFGDALSGFLVRDDGSMLFGEYRLSDRTRRLRLLRNDGTCADRTDIEVQSGGVWPMNVNAPGGAVLVSGVSAVAGERRFGLARLVPGPGDSAGSSPPRLANVSATVTVGPNDGRAIAGFVVQGEPCPVLIRGVGPGLRRFGVHDALGEAQIDFFAGSALLGTNRGWIDGAGMRDAFARVGAFPLDADSPDAALLATAPVGGATAILGPANGDSGGIGLVEIYDLGGDRSRAIRNISARARIGREAGTITAGFVVRGGGIARLLVRSIGPSLTTLGVPGALADPRLRIFHLNGSVLAENDNWSADESVAARTARAAAEVGAFALQTGSRDAAMLVAVTPGAYTVQLTSMDGGSGIALIEVYLLGD